jgi:hypothetical protein
MFIVGLVRSLLVVVVLPFLVTSGLGDTGQLFDHFGSVFFLGSAMKARHCPSASSQ